MRIVFIVLYLTCLTGISYAQDYRPSLRIEPQVEVSRDKVYLGDISSIKGDDQLFSKLIGDLKAIELGDAPRPMGSKILKGEEILSIIDGKGIPREAFGYTLPMQVTISRPGRVLTNQEVLESIKNKVNDDASIDMQVRSVRWDVEHVVPLGASRIESEILGKAVQGKMPVRINVITDESVSARFLATAIVDDWRSVPVLKNKVERGMLISQEDIQIIRANVTNLPTDIALDPQEIQGKRVIKSVSLGEPLRRSDLDIPPAVEKGKTVKMKFQSGAFTAVATGIAIQSGQIDDLIDVKNDRSNKIVKGKVVSHDEVLISN